MQIEKIENGQTEMNKKSKINFKIDTQKIKSLYKSQNETSRNINKNIKDKEKSLNASQSCKSYGNTKTNYKTYLNLNLKSNWNVNNYNKLEKLYDKSVNCSLSNLIIGEKENKTLTNLNSQLNRIGEENNSLPFFKTEKNIQSINSINKNTSNTINSMKSFNSFNSYINKAFPSFHVLTEKDMLLYNRSRVEQEISYCKTNLKFMKKVSNYIYPHIMNDLIRLHVEYVRKIKINRLKNDEIFDKKS